MKIIFLLPALLFLAFSSPAQHLILDPTALFKIAENERGNYAERMRSVSLAPSNDYDVHYHRLRWNVDPKIRFIQGEVTTYFVTLAPNFQTLHFDMSDSLKVDSIHYHQLNISFSQPSGDILSVILPAALVSGTEDSVSVFYSGIPHATGIGSFEVRSHGATVTGMDSVMWTLSEPYGSRDWWPGKMTLNDKVDSLDIYVTVPSGYSVASNGLPVDTTISGPSINYHWRTHYPIANYLIAFAATNYDFNLDTLHTSAGIVQIWNFWYPEFMPEWLQFKPDDHAMIRLFTDLFGAYPFINEKYGHAQMEKNGGMEHQTMTFVSDGGFELIAHEMAHQWFGDKLTCGSWQDIWLNEGFATYASILCYEYITPPEFHYYQISLRNLSNSVISQPGGSVYVDDTNNVLRIFDGRLTYYKGAYLIHMLRWKLGDDDFFQALKDYITDPLLSYNFSATNELKEHLELQSGQVLNEFFNDWFYGEGYPTYSLDWAQDADKKVSLIIRQTTSHPSVDFFEMPLPVKFKSNNRDTTIVFNHTQNDQHFDVPLSFFADSALIDPDLWILHGKSKVRKLPELDASEFVILRPNPASDFFQVWYDVETLNILSLKIYNIEGILMKDIPLDPIPSYTIDISISELPAGIYLLKIETPLGYVVRKLLKE